MSDSSSTILLAVHTVHTPTFYSASLVSCNDRNSTKFSHSTTYSILTTTKRLRCRSHNRLTWHWMHPFPRGWAGQASPRKESYHQTYITSSTCKQCPPSPPPSHTLTQTSSPTLIQNAQCSIEHDASLSALQNLCNIGYRISRGGI